MSATSSASDSVKTIYDLLTGAASSNWTNADPDVYYRWEITSKDIEGVISKPTFGVWSPVEGTLEAFDAEYDHIDETETVEVLIIAQTDTQAAQYADDTIDFLSKYGNDNESNTNFHRIRPTSVNDARAETIARKTDNYLASVTVEMRNFRPTG